MNRALILAETMEKLASGNDPNQNLSSRWAAFFEVAVDTPEYYSAVCATYTSFIELRHEIAESELRDRAKALYTGAVAHLIRFANPAQLAQQTVSVVKQSLDQINMLHLAADALPEHLIPELQQPVLDQLYEEMDEIIRAAATMETEPATRRVITESLSTLIMVLRNYKSLGPDGAARIYGSVAAELMRTYRQDPPKEGNVKTLFQKALGTVKKAGYAVIFAGSVVHGADQLLTDGSNVAGIILGDVSVANAGQAEDEPAALDDEDASVSPHDVA